MFTQLLRGFLLTAMMTASVVALTEAKPNVMPPQVASAQATSAQVTSLQRELPWMTDYAKAIYRAKAEGRMLLIAFCGSDAKTCDACLAPSVLDDPAVRKQLKPFLLLKLPNDARVDLGKEKEEKNVELLRHPTFREMCGRSGIAMIDFRDEKASYYGTVVSTFPVLGSRPYTKDQTLTILGLPPGTLTQRTLVYAVRTHPESPKSTEGEASGYLIAEASSHSNHQAAIRRQGHHNWDSRFQRISGRLPAGLLATEICAESWPNEGLLTAAIDCVQSWRHSSGHWRQVSSRHRLWGYDMRRGSNGIWYATGIFSQR